MYVLARKPFCNNGIKYIPCMMFGMPSYSTYSATRSWPDLK